LPTGVVTKKNTVKSRRPEEDGDVRDAADVPLLSPAGEGEEESPVYEGESNKRYDTFHDQAFVTVVEDVVAIS